MAASPRTDILPPRYAEVVLLAHGGMGEIYRATDETLGREVAVKVLAERYARDPGLRARFTREALAAARLSGEPHTVTIFDVGEWSGRPYIVMELASHGTVADRIARGRVEAARALLWLDQAADALDAAHRRGIVHRDVKPANLLLTRGDEVRVADFGIASAAGLASLTATGTVLGTFGYLAPEQAAGGEVGPAADRYALAVVAYELLAGRRPFQRETCTAEAAAAAREPVPRISLERDDLPAALDRVFARALAAEPARRYPSCTEFVGDLRRAFEDAAGATVVRVAASEPRRRRRTVPLALSGGALAAAGVAAAVLAWPGGGDRPTTATRPAVKTVTARGDTVTVTAPATPPPAPATPAATTPPAGTGASGAALNDEAWGRMKSGDYRGALPLLEQAVQKLQGTSSLAEAYALYNLAFTRFALGSCDGVLAMLDRSEAIQGRRAEIDDLRGKAAGCASAG